MKARIYAFDEVDRPEEVAKALTDLRQEMVNEVEALRTELAGCSRKKPKKGFVMKNVLISIAAVSMIFGSLAYGQYVKSDINYEITSNPDSLNIFLRDVLGSGTFEFTPIAAPTNNDIIEGKVYYDSSSKALFVSTNGTTWTQLDTAGGTSLDASYNLGSTIDVDTLAVTLTVSDTDNNVVMALVQNDNTNDPAALTIVFGSGSTGTGVSINSQANGTDIAGDNWSVDQAGKLTILEVDATGDFLFQGTTYDVAFDASREAMVWEDEAILGFGAASHDDAPDITYSFDATGSDLNITFDDLEIAYGSDGAGGDVFWYTETASNWLKMSEANDQLEFELIDLHLSSDSQIEFEGDNAAVDWAIDNDTDEVLLFTPTETSDDQSINFGNATNTTDFRLFGQNASTVVFNASDDEVVFTGYDINLTDTDEIRFGTGASGGAGDFKMSGSSGNKLLIDVVVPGTGAIEIGNDADDVPLTWFGETTGSDFILTGDTVLLDGMDMTFQDGDFLKFGDDGDFTMDSSTTKILDFTPGAASDDYKILMGLDQSGVDLKIFGATTGEYWLFDASADSILPVCGNALYTMTDAEANQFKVDAIGTVAGDAIVFKTTDGGILVDADGGANGDIELNAANDLIFTAVGATTFTNTATFTVGAQSTAFDATADDSEETINLIPAGTRVVNVSANTNGVTDFVTLSTGILGERCTIIATVACELRTLAASGDTINDIISDGAQEYQLTAGDIVELICVAPGSAWTAYSHTILGAAKTIIPD